MKYFTVLEGECEEAIVKSLKKEGYTFGTTYKKPIQDLKHIERVLFKVNKDTQVTIIMDTDNLNEGSKLERLISNLLYLVSVAKRVFLITQDQNLEDELIRALNLKNQTNLNQYFGAKNKRNYKTKLSQMNEKKLKIKIKDIDKTSFWSSLVLVNFTNKSEFKNINVTLKQIPVKLWYKMTSN